MLAPPTYNSDQAKKIIKLFDDAVAAEMSRGREKAEATRRVVKAHPALHREYLIVVNAGRPLAQQNVCARYAA